VDPSVQAAEHLLQDGIAAAAEQNLVEAIQCLPCWGSRWRPFRLNDGFGNESVSGDRPMVTSTNVLAKTN
jgi:hypothetical protein